MIAAQRIASVEKRSEPRKTYSGAIFFATKKGFYEGSLKNYSRNGLFISTRDMLPVGEVLTIALPYLDNNHNTEKRSGQIMWSCKEGFGVELFRDRRIAY
jgi:hypothetical protein